MSAPRIDTLSHLLDRSFRLWWSALPWTAPLALLAALPSLHRMITLPGLAELLADPEVISLAVVEKLLQRETWLWWGFSALVTLWSAGAQCLLLDRSLREEPLGFANALLRSTLRLPVLLLSTVLYLLLCGLPLLPLLGFNAWLGLQGMDLLPMLALSVAGSTLVLLPIAWIAVRLVFLPYAAAVDGLGPLRGLQRSRRIAEGQWWRLLVFLSIPLTIYGVAATAALAVPLTLAIVTGSAAASLIGTLAGLLTAALGGPMLHACLVCAYREVLAPQQS
ncbi:small multi-drug export protein [Aquimonas voraii]|uniref:DUF7847 domain-containing protein n=1 Tax=Aquimonas voraii TaxID=265719 RepID=A0A1G6V0K2_9GAMM|nr:small multi-drug export protein [Aquimonas voraii]SDD47013.1 hypothetical protein SAMN04488509_102582 [Aquimonas voraii]